MPQYSTEQTVCNSTHTNFCSISYCICLKNGGRGALPGNGVPLQLWDGHADPVYDKKLNLYLVQSWANFY